MSTEDPFRIGLLIIFLLTVAVVAYHRLQAASTGERISRKAEGIMFAIVLRTVGIHLWLITLAYAINPRWLQWARLPIPDGVRWWGFAGGVAGSLLMYWTLTSLGKNLTDTVVTRRNAYLVTHGPYRWIRHPFYVTTALLMASVTLLTANWLIGLGSLGVLAMLSVRTPKEEQMLIERFGQAYCDYMQTTGRYWPKVRGERAQGTHKGS
jgi:protein-S-isoprenylcysteine O-methyltransferase Ste14